MKSPTSVNSDEVTRSSSCILDENDDLSKSASISVDDIEYGNKENNTNNDTYLHDVQRGLQDNYSTLSFANKYASDSKLDLNFDNCIPSNETLSEWINPECRIGNFAMQQQSNHQFFQQPSSNNIPRSEVVFQMSNHKSLERPDPFSIINTNIGFQQPPSVLSSSLFTNCIRGVDSLSYQQEPSFTQNTDVLTQNQELTQSGDAIDDNSNIFSPLPQSTMKVDVLNTPWGRLVPTSSNQVRVDLLPRSPQPDSSSEIMREMATNNEVGMSIFGLHNLQTYDIFNEYTIGRKKTCDVTINSQIGKMNESSDSKQTRQDRVFGLISNCHCRIYCTLSAKTSFASIANRGVDVYIEDCSENGTVINKTTILRRGEKRLLHQGDEICLVNIDLIRKTLRNSNRLISDAVQHYTFIFMNCIGQYTEFSSPMIPFSHHIQQSIFSKDYPIIPSNCCESATKSADTDNTSSKLLHFHQNTDASLRHSYTPSMRPLITTTTTIGAYNGTRSKKMDAHQVKLTPVRRIPEDYDIRDLLGSGTVGNVHRAIHRRTGHQCAVKIIPLSRNRTNFTSTNSRKHDATQQFEAEAKILQSLGDHPYIVKLIDVYVTADVAVYLVMELVQGGDLFDRIADKGHYSETESRRVMRRLLSAVYYLHEERNIVHRDLKPENILCKSYKNNIDIKITDFGLAKAVNGNDDVLKTFCGTPQYFAPEVLKRRNTVTGRGRYGKQADMWSVGVILYVLLSGTPPFDAAGDSVAYVKQINFPDEYWNHVSPDAKDLIVKLLVKEPSKRYTIKDACNHKWIITDDGDTHMHPLDDPQLLTLKGKAIQARLSISSTVGRQAPGTSFVKNKNGANRRSRYRRTSTNPVSPDENDAVNSDDLDAKQPDCSIQLSDRHPLSPIVSNIYRVVKTHQPITDQNRVALNDFAVGVFPQRKHIVSINQPVDDPMRQFSKDISGCRPGTDIKEHAKQNMEPNDDEIISQFSEQTESISSFVSEPQPSICVDDSFAIAARLFQKISPLDTAQNIGRKPVGKDNKRKCRTTNVDIGVGSSSENAAAKRSRKTKNAADDHDAHSKISSGNRKDRNHPCKRKQMTLSGWVTKPV